jgi:methylenetetrahydrofolate dehydrogenase (NADP+)/methenyltetrahydrofolate cyclohydrolase
VGDDAGAGIYQQAVRRYCEGIGIVYGHESFAPGAEHRDVLDRVQALNADPLVSGVLPLRPFSDRSLERSVILALDIRKDVDCLHPLSMGKLALGTPEFVSATPAACMELLERYLLSEGHDPQEGFRGASFCVVGRSSSVGRPLALLALNRDATVTVVHTGTGRAGTLQAHTSRADYLVVAAGAPGFVGADHVKEGAVVLDVGINQVWVCAGCGAHAREPEGACAGCGNPLAEARPTVVGDVRFDEVVGKAAAVSPVPGGVGAVTNAMLAKNVVRAAALLHDVVKPEG